MDAERRELWGASLGGGLQLHRPLGSGATGIVFAATDRAGRSLAVKLLKPSQAHHRSFRRRLEREARVSHDVRHPGVVPCYGVGTLGDGSPFVVFERLRGVSLLDLLARRGALTLGEALAIGRRLARVLSAVHAAGYVHRDVKPEHVMLFGDRGMLGVRLIDFGICLSRGESLEPWETGTVFGTPGYASPEQITGEPSVDGRTDLFGLGATLFHALTGVPPHRGHTAAAVLHRTLLEDAPSVSWLRPGVSRSLDRVVHQLLARNRDLRPWNGRQVARALAAVSDTPLQAAEEGLLRAVTRRRERAGASRVTHDSPTRALAAHQA